MTAYVIGIDQSTQSTKAFLYNADGEIVAKAALPHQQLINDKGWISHNLDEIWDNLLQVMDRLLHTANVDNSAIQAVGITNQRETAAAWSRSTGHAIGNAIVWQDARAKALCDDLAKSQPTVVATLQPKTGLPLSPYFAGAKFAWLLQNRPAVRSAAHNNDLCLGTIDSWLLYRLTNGRSFKTELSNACRTALLDLDNQKWDHTFCQLFGISEQFLPEVVDSDADFGETDFDGLLPRKVPINGMIADSQGALFGQNGLQVGALKATYGTGSSIMANVGSVPIHSTAGLVSSIGWRQSGHTSYVLEGNINYTGALITWLKDGLHLIDNPGDTSTLADAANPRDQTVIVPAFTGLGAPYWKEDAKAAILNMTAVTKRPEIVKAALDAIVFQIQAVIASVRPDVNQLGQNLRVDGGPTHNAYLMQRQSDISNLTIEVPNNEDMSAFGAALMAGQKCGVFSPGKDYVKYKQYRPAMAQDVRRKDVARWEAAVATVEAQTKEAG